MLVLKKQKLRSRFFTFFQVLLTIVSARHSYGLSKLAPSIRP